MKMIRQSTISGMMQARGTQMPRREFFDVIMLFTRQQDVLPIFIVNFII